MIPLAQLFQFSTAPKVGVRTSRLVGVSPARSACAALVSERRSVHSALRQNASAVLACSMARSNLTELPSTQLSASGRRPPLLACTRSEMYMGRRASRHQSYAMILPTVAASSAVSPADRSYGR